jgi:hypothetical protein
MHNFLQGIYSLTDFYDIQQTSASVFNSSESVNQMGEMVRSIAFIRGTLKLI